MHVQFKLRYPERGFFDEVTTLTQQALQWFADAVKARLQEKITTEKIITDPNYAGYGNLGMLEFGLDVHILTLEDLNKLLDWCDKHDCLNLTDDLIKQILEE